MLTLASQSTPKDAQSPKPENPTWAPTKSKKEQSDNQTALAKRKIEMTGIIIIVEQMTGQVKYKCCLKNEDVAYSDATSPLHQLPPALEHIPIIKINNESIETG
ncbi:hypothetical protein PRIPAC_97585 [Pristionchus pacificus]|uniref:Uncharacterized protein n=1 Tax=Pristionchus pacificus TaxID=54126 RepID=A0A2A6B3C0_PRIPA|nr:hypothetical protein PRIPAC_97585 [Pristionchus pacificus]|eukprot:PDM60385.1 hypothetical protein PRIPAC_54210 [Pristionchus pacificus]